MSRRLRFGFLAGAGLLAACGFLLAADAPTLQAETGGAQAARGYFPNTLLTDQRGEAHRFHTDLLEGKVVVIGVVASDCTEHCPRALKTWGEAQEALGKRMGGRVHFLTLPADPRKDSAETMRALAKSSHAGKGWYFLSGTPESVRLVLAKLDLAPKEDGSHANRWVVANIETGMYKIGPDTMTSEQLLDTVEECLADE